MALRNTRRDFAPIVLVFVMITALAIVFRSGSVAWNLDSDVVIFGNLFLFLVTLFFFFYCQKGVAGQKPACDGPLNRVGKWQFLRAPNTGL